MGSATHTAPSASRQMPSGGANGIGDPAAGTSSANVRRPDKVPSGSTANAVSRDPPLSATIKVRPSSLST